MHVVRTSRECIKFGLLNVIQLVTYMSPYHESLATGRARVPYARRSRRGAGRKRRLCGPRCHTAPTGTSEAPARACHLTRVESSDEPSQNRLCSPNCARIEQTSDHGFGSSTIRSRPITAFIVEANDQALVTRLMGQRFVWRAPSTACSIAGTCMDRRYHARALRTPREVRTGSCTLMTGRSTCRAQPISILARRRGHSMLKCRPPWVRPTRRLRSWCIQRLVLSAGWKRMG